MLALAINAFSQGIAYFHAGQELLRSKSMDRNSYNSGDWFNRLDWTYSDNGFAAGLPPRTVCPTQIDALAQAGASALRDRPFTALSYGEQRRVLIARALATGARVLLLDEPTAALDLEQSLRLLELLGQLASEGYAIVVVLHALDDAIRHTDRTLLLHEGRVDQLGVSREVLSPETIRRVYGVVTEESAGLRFSLPTDARAPGLEGTR